MIQKSDILVSKLELKPKTKSGPFIYAAILNEIAPYLTDHSLKYA